VFFNNSLKILYEGRSVWNSRVIFVNTPLKDKDNIFILAYALVKDLKYFRVYVLQSEITAYVPSSAVK